MDNLKNTIIAISIAFALLLSCKTTYMEGDWEFLEHDIMTNDYEDADVINTDTIPNPTPEDPDSIPDTISIYNITPE